jgi:hypothetical protein
MIDYFALAGILIAVLMCVGGAVFLAYHKVSGWGWFLFLAFLISTGFKINIGG